jgi:hypothetical protein
MTAATEVRSGTPVFSERLSEVLATMLKGEAPNAGCFCGRCYTPIDPQRGECPHCGVSTAQRPPVERVPSEVIEMFRRMRRRESLVVNSLAFAGLFLGVIIFIAIFYALFILGANIWWYVFDIVLLFVLSRGLAGLIGGIIGDNLGYRYSRRKLAEEWAQYEAWRTRA